jgi:hypothetical protein
LSLSCHSSLLTYFWSDDDRSEIEKKETKFAVTTPKPLKDCIFYQSFCLVVLHYLLVQDKN